MSREMIVKKPPPAKLDSRAKKLLRAMWYGVDKDITLSNGEIIPAGTPMGDTLAARAIGMQRRYLEYWRHQRVFKDALHEQSIARRQAEEPRNLAVAIQIRDNDYDTRTRLAAISIIRVKDPVPAVHVDFSQHSHDNRQQTLVAPAGYVVNLGEPMKKEEK